MIEITTMPGRTILIADDEKPLANALQLKLKKEGFDVNVSYDGLECIQAVQKVDPEILLLDLVMPNLDGFGVLEKLKELKSKAKVIVLSNLSQDEDVTRVKSLGAVNYFVKSNTPLKDIVDYVIKLLQNEPPQ